MTERRYALAFIKSLIMVPTYRIMVKLGLP